MAYLPPLPSQNQRRFNASIRRLGCALIIALVTGITIGHVSSVEAAPSAGAVCSVVGRERVTAAGTLRCVAGRSRVARWRLVSREARRFDVSTPPTARTAVAPSVSGIVADSESVRFTLSGMTPDTGVYSVQWVERGETFNSFRMVRATSRLVAIDSNSFRCNRTYTFRVFTMRPDWLLTEGHSTQNVTPHSEPFDVTMNHGCSGRDSTGTTTTTVPAPSCAAGDACQVGDTGPGGGIVFYVHPGGGTFPCGESLSSTCRYLEVAPNDQGTPVTWCSNNSVSLSVTSTAIGAGLRNTTVADGTCTSGGVQVAADYSRNSFSDWGLPSRLEMNELCKFARGQATGDTSVACDSTGALNVDLGFQTNRWYWTSSETGSTSAWSLAVDFSGNPSPYDDAKGSENGVRPIRAFGGTFACRDGGQCAVGDTGPGGGTVFYVHSSGTFSSTGSDCGTSCRYFEVGPTDLAVTNLVTSALGCFPAGSLTLSDCQSNSFYSGTASEQETSRTASQAIGMGMPNTNLIYERVTTVGGSLANSYGAGRAWEYSNDRRTDWHLPSRDELNELCKYARSQATGDSAVRCDDTGTLRGAFLAGKYRSSSEFSLNSAWAVDFSATLTEGRPREADWQKNWNIRVRPVRAFTCSLCTN